MGLAFDLPARLVTAAGPQALQVALAGSFWRRFRGLMLAAPLQVQPCPQGLLLTDCTSVHGCFMRYPLDVVFLARPDTQGVYRVTGTARLPRWGMRLGQHWRDPANDQRLRAAHVLELPAGTVAHWGVQAGDRLSVACAKTAHSRKPEELCL
ncbi:DUF192 domain-containing protein [Comamonas nitrativorans]|uniref:DUF192 domain-containing protein n=1 Tax=Comamonas nitrativorans TaxID=108437 RepID=A0ABV9GWF5_9BURK